MALRVDAHQHFWIYNPADYVWMTSDMAALRRNFLPDDLQPLLDGAGMDASVAVQARRMVAETAWLLGLAERHPSILGVVGWVDFASEALEPQLEGFAAHPKLKGVRELIHDMADDDYALSDVHVRAMALLESHRLTYDLLLKPPHLHPATALVDRFPNQPFVVDHIAKPDIQSGAMAPWDRDLRALAERPNVHCKLSGMVTECDWRRWSPEQIRPYLEIALEAFGSERVMIGSDWPVCTLAGDYGPVMGVVTDFVAALSETERYILLICLCPTLRMTHDHPTLIKEAPSELLEHERRHRHSITGSRIRMLRLLKRGEAKSVREAGELIGYSWRHTRRWLTTY